MYECRYCDREFETKQARGSHEGHSHDQNNTVECYTCGDKFEKYVSQIEKYDKHFCSEECRIEWLEESHNSKGSSSPSWDGGKVTVKCSVCGDEIKRWPSQTTHRVVCSEECFSELHSETVSGENNPNWIDGVVREYGERWDSIREEIIERDGEKCLFCGVERDTHKNFYGRDLSVHHIEPLRDFDSTEEANRRENLITVCSSCHNKVEEGVLSVDQTSMSEYM